MLGYNSIKKGVIMDIMDVCDRLLYDKEKFIIYLDYRNKLDNDIFMKYTTDNNGQFKTKKLLKK